MVGASPALYRPSNDASREAYSALLSLLLLLLPSGTTDDEFSEAANLALHAVHVESQNGRTWFGQQTGLDGAVDERTWASISAAARRCSDYRAALVAGGSAGGVVELIAVRGDEEKSSLLTGNLEDPFEQTAGDGARSASLLLPAPSGLSELAGETFLADILSQHLPPSVLDNAGGASALAANVAESLADSSLGPRDLEETLDEHFDFEGGTQAVIQFLSKYRVAVHLCDSRWRNALDSQAIGNQVRLAEYQHPGSLDEWGGVDSVVSFLVGDAPDAARRGADAEQKDEHDEDAVDLRDVTLTQGERTAPLQGTFDSLLPAGSQESRGPGFERFDIPAVDRPARPLVQHLAVKGVFPPWAQACFPEQVTNLNPMQSAVFPSAWFGVPAVVRKCEQDLRSSGRVNSLPKGPPQVSNHLLVSAPTGAGKTNVALTCLLAAVRREVEHALAKPGVLLRPSGAEPQGVELQADQKAALAEADAPTVRRFIRRLDRECARSMGTLFKVVYVAPMKALGQEMVTSFQERLRPLGLNVKELSGDSSLSGAGIRRAHVLVCTPEKWDVVTRKCRADVKTFADAVRLLIIDEIHLLHSERGAVLESVIARAKRYPRTRMVGLSATLPNCADVAELLGVSLCGGTPASWVKKGEGERSLAECPDGLAPAQSELNFVHRGGLLEFGSQFRPCPLQQTFVALNDGSFLKRRQTENRVCYQEVVNALRNGKQVLIFVHSRKGTVETAKEVLRMAETEEDPDTRETVARALLAPRGPAKQAVAATVSAGGVSSAEVRKLLQSGAGVHHAGLEKGDRAAVETLFGDRHVKLLVSTATLAWGCNLPASTVIIKGTQVYSPAESRFVELSFLDVLQMIGRAGRPQFDVEGKGIIITNRSELPYYLRLLTSQLPIESQMGRRLAELLNAEIAGGSVGSVDACVDWLLRTYLPVRMRENPSLYSTDEAVVRAAKVWRAKFLAGEQVPQHPMRPALTGLVKNALRQLGTCGLVHLATHSVEPTALGVISANYSLMPEAVRGYVERMRGVGTHGDGGAGVTSDTELLKLFSSSDEFKQLAVRAEERQELNDLSRSVPLPLTARDVESVHGKVSILLQCYVADSGLSGLTLASDMVFIRQSAGRLFRALFELALKQRAAHAARLTLTWSRAVQHRCWPTACPLRQFFSGSKGASERRLRGSRALLVQALERSRTPLRDMSPDELQALLESLLQKSDRKQELFAEVSQHIAGVPQLKVTASRLTPLDSEHFQVEAAIEADFDWGDDSLLQTVAGGRNSLHFVLLLTDSSGSRLLHSQAVPLERSAVLRGTALRAQREQQSGSKLSNSMDEGGASRGADVSQDAALDEADLRLRLLIRQTGDVATGPLLLRLVCADYFIPDLVMSFSAPEGPGSAAGTAAPCRPPKKEARSLADAEKDMASWLAKAEAEVATSGAYSQEDVVQAAKVLVQRLASAREQRGAHILHGAEHEAARTLLSKPGMNLLLAGPRCAGLEEAAIQLGTLAAVVAGMKSATRGEAGERPPKRSSAEGEEAAVVAPLGLRVYICVPHGQVCSQQYALECVHQVLAPGPAEGKTALHASLPADSLRLVRLTGDAALDQRLLFDGEACAAVVAIGSPSDWSTHFALRRMAPRASERVSLMLLLGAEGVGRSAAYEHLAVQLSFTARVARLIAVSLPTSTSDELAVSLRAQRKFAFSAAAGAPRGVCNFHLTTHEAVVAGDAREAALAPLVAELVRNSSREEGAATGLCLPRTVLVAGGGAREAVATALQLRARLHAQGVNIPSGEVTEVSGEPTDLAMQLLNGIPLSGVHGGSAGGTLADFADLFEGRVGVLAEGVHPLLLARAVDLYRSGHVQVLVCSRSWLLETPVLREGGAWLTADVLAATGADLSIDDLTLLRDLVGVEKSRGADVSRGPPAATGSVPRDVASTDVFFGLGGALREGWSEALTACVWRGGCRDVNEREAWTHLFPDASDKAPSREAFKALVLQVPGAVSESKERAPLLALSASASAAATFRMGVQKELPVESALLRSPHACARLILQEVRNKTVQKQQDALDLLLRTVGYHRVQRNPGYYGALGGGATVPGAAAAARSGSGGLSKNELETFMSVTVLKAFDVLESQQLAVRRDDELVITPRGRRAASSGLSLRALQYLQDAVEEAAREHQTAQRGSQAAVWPLVSVLSHALALQLSEADSTELWTPESATLRASGWRAGCNGAGLRLGLPNDGALVPQPQGEEDFIEPESENASGSSSSLQELIRRILDSHTARTLPAYWSRAARVVLPLALQMLVAATEACAFAGWFSGARLCVQRCQRLVQAVAPRRSNLLQLPYCTEERAAAAEMIVRAAWEASASEGGTSSATRTKPLSLYDVATLEDADFEKLVAVVVGEGRQATQTQRSAVTGAVNRNPDVVLKASSAAAGAAGADAKGAGASRIVECSITRERGVEDGEEEALYAEDALIVAPHFPAPRAEAWWVFAHTPDGVLLDCKRLVACGDVMECRLKLPASVDVAKTSVDVRAFCECYLGCDQLVRLRA